MEETIVDLLERLRVAGFSAELWIAGDSVRAPALGRRYHAREFEVLGVHRFEGESNPSDMAVVHAIEAPDGTRGVLVNAYGPYADPEVASAIAQMRRGHRSFYGFLRSSTGTHARPVALA